jgi:hypothetical protein
MIVCILETGLEDVVIDVLRRLANRDAVLGHLLELEPSERAGRILQEGLVHAERDFLARLHLSIGKVRANQLAGEWFSHGSASGHRENFVAYED